MRLIVLRSAIALVCLIIVWIAAGRTISLVFDRVIRGPAVRLATNPVIFDGGILRIGNTAMLLAGLDNNAYPLSTDAGDSGRVALNTAGRTFELGTRTSGPRHSGDPQIELAADPADRIEFTARTSLIGWATPFEFNFIGRSPSWKKYVYYSLVWRKAGGQELRMKWRYRQTYYMGAGWTSPDMQFDSDTGLTEVVVE